MRILSVVGARPQFVKLAPIAAAIEAAGLDHRIVHTGQHYDDRMSEAFFADLRIPPPDVHLGVGSGTHGVQTGGMLARLDEVFTHLAPDWVLVYGDTNSTLAGALAAVKLHLPVAHLEAGLRSRNRRMPEEHNRVLADHAADLCLAPTELALRNLEQEGLGRRTCLIGDVMTDVCLQARDHVLAAPRLKLPGLGGGESFLLATVHRAENTDDPGRLDELIQALADLPVPVVLPAHPRLRARAGEFGLELHRGSIRIVPPLRYPEMVAAVLQAQGVITDSGGLQKEAYLLGRPCTTLRAETEWPETLANGWNVLDPQGHRLRELARRQPPLAARALPYGDGRAAERAVTAIRNFNG